MQEWKTQSPTSCEYSKLHKLNFEVELSKKAYSTIQELITHFYHLEWMVFLVGLQSEDSYFYISELIIPRQTVTAATVAVDEKWEKKYSRLVEKGKVLGTLHSHNNMQVFHSQTDLNAAFSMGMLHGVVNNRFDFLWAVKKKLPCGLEGLYDSSKTILPTAVPQKVLNRVKKNSQFEFGFTRLPSHYQPKTTIKTKESWYE